MQYRHPIRLPYFYSTPDNAKVIRRFKGTIASFTGKVATIILTAGSFKTETYIEKKVLSEIKITNVGQQFYYIMIRFPDQSKGILLRPLKTKAKFNEHITSPIKFVSGLSKKAEVITRNDGVVVSIKGKIATLALITTTGKGEPFHVDASYVKKMGFTTRKKFFELTVAKDAQRKLVGLLRRKQ